MVPSQWNGTVPPLTTDGYLASPVASHSYNANVYLPVLDRLAVFGGAALRSGTAFQRPDSSLTGPYFFNPALADPRTSAPINGQKVGGLINSDPLGTAPAGNMWQNRDNIAGNTGGVPMAAQSACAYALEGGVDVVYVLPCNGSAGPLVRYVPSASGPSSDTYAVVGASFHSTAPGPIALAPNLKCMVRMGGTPFSYWDLTSPGPGNNDVTFTPTDNSGIFPALDVSISVDWDEQYGRFAIVHQSAPGKVWTLTPPSPLSPTGWVINLAPAPTSSLPGFDPGSSGTFGLWRRIKAHQCFIYSADVSSGPDAWIYKSHA